jgi:hypothetical protein
MLFLMQKSFKCFKLEGVMESYIIRIYRYENNNPRSFVGVVEEVGVPEKRAFTNLEELWNILNFKNSKGGGDDSGSFGVGNLGGF